MSYQKLLIFFHIYMLFTGTSSSGSLHSPVFILHSFTCIKHLKGSNDWLLEGCISHGNSLVLSCLF